MSDGLPSILELLRVLIHVLDPNDQQHTDSTRLIVLGILNAALEEVGPRITDFPSLEALILDPGCKFLFQLARSENSSVLHSSLRTISTMFDTMRQHLKLQQELFLAFTIDRLAPTLSKVQQAISKKGVYAGSPRPGTPGTPSLGPVDDELQLEKQASTPPRLLVPPARGETRDLSLEILSQISRHASFMVDLYTNYDCDINCENLMERLIDFLTKVSSYYWSRALTHRCICPQSVYPAYYSGGLDVQQRNAQFLCLDLLLAFVNDMAGRANGVCNISFQNYIILTGLLFLGFNPVAFRVLISRVPSAEEISKEVDSRWCFSFQCKAKGRNRLFGGEWTNICRLVAGGQ